MVSGKHKPHYFVFVRLSLDRHRNNFWNSKAETKKYVIPKEIEVFTIFLSKVMGSDGFCNRTNLIYFQKQTIAGFFVNGHLNSFWVGNSQIVSNNLNISWTSQFCPSFPIILEKIETFLKLFKTNKGDYLKYRAKYLQLFVLCNSKKCQSFKNGTK